jgi:RNA polymerase sigma factor (sigma-70 family)
LVDIIPEALASAVLAHISKLGRLPTGRAELTRRPVATTLRRLESGRFTQEVSVAFTQADYCGALSDLIAAETLDGVDAERLCGALINLETHRHIPLVWHQANKLAKSFPGRSPEDLAGWGWQGLRVALRQFDPGRGYAFSTYACTRIMGYMRDGIRSESPVPKRLATFSHKAARIEESLTQEQGRVPNLQAVADQLGQGLADLALLGRLGPAASLDEMVDTGRDQTTFLVEREDPAEAAVAAVRRDAIDEALGRIPESEATAVRLLVLEGLEPRDARSRTGVSTRQLRQRRDRGLVLLRAELEEWDPGALMHAEL